MWVNHAQALTGQIIAHHHSSFPAKHKVDNVDIFVPLLMEINRKEELGEYMLMQIYICHAAAKKALFNKQLYQAYFQI